MGNFKDLTGRQFGRLTVLERAENYVSPKGQQKTMWLCQCDCEKHTIKKISSGNLLKGITQSCGCLQKENVILSHRKNNIYNLSDKNNCFLYASNSNNIFYFDYEDYNKIKDYCWTEDGHGYLFSLTKGERVAFHRFVMGVEKQSFPLTNESVVVDHIDGNIKNNRKENLRKCLPKENSWNRKVSQGKSGIIGVFFHKNCNKWGAFIEYDKVYYNLGYYETKEEAIIARLKKEKELFGDFAGQSFMFEEYGI